MEEKNNTQIIEIVKRKPGRPKVEKPITEVKEPSKSRGRPRKYEEGCAQFIKDSKYNNQYYHLTNKKITCEICGKETTKRTINQHHSTLKCKLIRHNIHI